SPSLRAPSLPVESRISPSNAGGILLSAIGGGAGRAGEGGRGWGGRLGGAEWWTCRPGGAGYGTIEAMTETKPVESWLTDMDGVLVHEQQALPGAAEFIEALMSSGRRFLVLTNNSIFTPRDLRARLRAGGIDIPEDAIWTSAMAAAQFLDGQRRGGSAYV